MKTRILAVVALFILVIPAALQSQAIDLTREQPLVDAKTINAYAKENLGAFTTATLDNGIPVIVKRNATNRIMALKTVLIGQSSLVPVDKAGLEAAMLTMLAKGSQKYSYADVQRVLFEDSASIAPASMSFDMSSFDLFTIDTYFDRLFDVYADAFLHPAWNAEEFPRVMNDLKLAKQQTLNDPYSLAINNLNEKFFTGHPYASSWDGTEASLASITLDDVKAYYEKNILSGRMFIVAVGNFDPAALVKKLNAAFGKMPKTPFTRPAVPSFQGTVTPDLIQMTYPQSEDIAYVRADYALPAPDDPEFPKIQVMLTLLDDVLFEILRTEHGSCYSVWAGAHPFTASYGDITVYKTGVPGSVKQWIDDSIAVLVSGKSLAGKVNASAEGKSGIGTEAAPEEQKGVFVPIAEALPFYKLQFLSSFYTGQQTNISVAAQIASSIVYHGDYRDFLFTVDKVSAVTPADVVEVTIKWLKDNPKLWVVLGDAAVLNGVNKDDFMKYLGK